MSMLHRCLCADLIYSVEERKSPGTFVGNIAQDSHVVANIPTKDHPLVTFIQLNQDTEDKPQLFYVHKVTGKIYTGEILDAEAMCKRNTECFQMLDVAVQKGSSTIKILEVKVIIDDINDHQPEFPNKQVHIEFSEGDGIGIRKSIPSASDNDVGIKNSDITYELIKNKDEPFTLTDLRNVAGKSYLSITLEKMLDREAKDSYLIKVTAKDRGSPPKQSILEVYISVTDLNDNTPIFSKDTYKVTAKNEPSQSFPITAVSASDLDAGKNGQISYHFSSETPEKLKAYFQLKEMTGEIFLIKKFAMEQEVTHNLFIEATDKGSPPLSSLAKFQVKVIGQENSAPIININFVSKQSRNIVNIAEDIKVGGFIAYVKVSDNDVGQNGEVSCNLQHNKFQLQNLGIKKYKVMLKTALDRERETHYSVEISCQDKGSPPLQSKSKFSILVTDVNDVRPQFSMETFKFFIEENQKSRFSMGFINATDPDLGLGGKLMYSLLTNKKQKFLPFKIQNDGMISAVMSLDHEFQNIYKFQVFVKDSGVPSLNNTVNVIVEVTDKNDNAPYFLFPTVNPFNMDVVYHAHHTKNITQIKASDSDSQENAFLKYEIIRGNSKQIFTINQYTGLLSSTHVLSQQDAGSYELEFLVKDSGSPVLSARTTVYLTLTMSNKTSEILNVVNIKKDNKIHLTSAIIIVSVAVMMAVVITVSISVCILQCNRQKNMVHRKQVHPSNRSVNEQKHLIGPSYHGNSWHHVPLTMESNHTLGRNNQQTASKKHHPVGDSVCIKQKTSKSAHKPKTPTELPLVSISLLSLLLFIPNVYLLLTLS